MGHAGDLWASYRNICLKHKKCDKPTLALPQRMIWHTAPSMLGNGQCCQHGTVLVILCNLWLWWTVGHAGDLWASYRNICLKQKKCDKPTLALPQRMSWHTAPSMLGNGQCCQHGTVLVILCNLWLWWTVGHAGDLWASYRNICLKHKKCDKPTLALPQRMIWHTAPSMLGNGQCCQHGTVLVILCNLWLWWTVGHAGDLWASYRNICLKHKKCDKPTLALPQRMIWHTAPSMLGNGQCCQHGTVSVMLYNLWWTVGHPGDLWASYTSDHLE